jgi:serpin B
MLNCFVTIVKFSGMFCMVGALLAATSGGAQQFDSAATATNQLAIDLHRQLATGNDNLCISPYSIQSALAMTFAGAAGETRTEMARVLRYPNQGDAIDASFASLQHSLEQMSANTAEIAKESKRFGGPSEPITITIANRLFAQSGYDFRKPFLAEVKQNFGAAFEPLDFIHDASGATQHINQWVAHQTRDRIRHLIPAGSLNDATRIVLTNAIYLKAPWASEFSEAATKPEPFRVRGGTPVDVPMMRKRSDNFGYVKRDGYTAVSVPYVGNNLHFVILVPDEANGLSALESKLTADILAQCAKLEKHDVDLSLPKFKFEPPTIALAEKLEELGMKTAFDRPPGSANFDRMAPRRPNDYLYISQVFHKTFIAVDEKGTEAAAATAVAMMAGAAPGKPPRPPIEVKVDRPFVYAIQHVQSGVCLFLGRVTDPR